MFLPAALESLNIVGLTHTVSYMISKYAIFVLSLFMALDQLNIAKSIVNAAFILRPCAFAVVFALSFGIGGRKFASK